MAIQRFKVALNNALFPLVSTKAQRAAFVQGLTAAACSLGTDRGPVISCSWSSDRIMAHLDCSTRHKRHRTRACRGRKAWRAIA